MKGTIRTVCAHDCPDQCSLVAHVEDGRVVRIEGDHELGDRVVDSMAFTI